MGAIAEVLSSQDLNTSESLFSLLEQSWYCKSVLNHAEKSITNEFDEADLEPCSSGCSINSERRSSIYSCSINSERRSSINSCSTTNCRANSVDEAEMRRVFDKFDENADGSICNRELQRFMSIWGIELSDAEVSSMIESVDVNQDGGVDFAEFLSLYHTCILDQKSTGSEKVEANTERDYEEKDDLLEAFRVFDKNQDGFISAKELQAVLTSLGMHEGRSLRKCEKMIHGVDRDNNGKCDIQEFQNMMSFPMC